MFDGFGYSSTIETLAKPMKNEPSETACCMLMLPIGRAELYSTAVPNSFC